MKSGRMTRWQRKRERKQALKKLVWTRDGGSCAYCGESLEFRNATLDHLIPKSQGGSRGPENVVLACLECNREKGKRFSKSHLELAAEIIRRERDPRDPDDEAAA